MTLQRLKITMKTQSLTSRMMERTPNFIWSPRTTPRSMLLLLSQLPRSPLPLPLPLPLCQEQPTPFLREESWPSHCPPRRPAPSPTVTRVSLTSLTAIVTLGTTGTRTARLGYPSSTVSTAPPSTRPTGEALPWLGPNLLPPPAACRPSLLWGSSRKTSSSTTWTLSPLKTSLRRGPWARGRGRFRLRRPRMPSPLSYQRRSERALEKASMTLATARRRRR